MTTRICRASTLALIALAFMSMSSARAQSASDTARMAKGAPALRDGQHDFDVLFGKWKYHLKQLVNPLTGSKKWIEFDGTGSCRPVWNGRAQIDELDVDGPSGHIEGLTLRLYNPDTHQWYLNWMASVGIAPFGPPTVGSFENGRGEFFDQELRKGRMILVRYAWSQMSHTSAHFEQSFSDDGGKTWEVNWITDQVRIGQ
jgi:hypothetical protein